MQVLMGGCVNLIMLIGRDRLEDRDVWLLPGNSQNTVIYHLGTIIGNCVMGSFIASAFLHSCLSLRALNRVTVWSTGIVLTVCTLCDTVLVLVPLIDRCGVTVTSENRVQYRW